MLNNLLEAYRSGQEIIFDLDNTIYQETDFLFPAYELIAKTHFEASIEEVVDFLITGFEKTGRRHLFDTLLATFPKPHLTTSHLVHTMRTGIIKQDLLPYSWFNSFMSEVDDRFILRIVTNGNPIQQQKKLNAIQWPQQVYKRDFVLANSYKPKPAPDSFFALKGSSEFLSPIYVGDSQSDKMYADNLGIQFLDANILITDKKTK